MTQEMHPPPPLTFVRAPYYSFFRKKLRNNRVTPPLGLVSSSGKSWIRLKNRIFNRLNPTIQEIWYNYYNYKGKKVILIIVESTIICNYFLTANTVHATTFYLILSEFFLNNQEYEVSTSVTYFLYLTSKSPHNFEECTPFY